LVEQLCASAGLALKVVANTAASVASFMCMLFSVCE
jgi:hypothetical protein